MIKISNFVVPVRTEQEAYDMGFDCGKNGANEKNCHFSLFASHEKMKAWELGKKAGENSITREGMGLRLRK